MNEIRITNLKDSLRCEVHNLGNVFKYINGAIFIRLQNYRVQKIKKEIDEAQM